MTPSRPKLLPTLLLTAVAQLPAHDATGQQGGAPLPGRVMSALPREVARIVVDGDTVYYRDGAFFRLTPAGYVVIRAPLGVPVPALPAGAARVQLGTRTFWYHRGAFYARPTDGAGYVTVSPPLGAVVESLPPDVSAIADIGGVLYYLYGGAFYRPILLDGRTAYLVSEP